MKKVLVLICCTLLVITGTASATLDVDSQEKIIEETPQFAPALAIGIMKNIETTTEYRDYEVTLFCIIMYGGETLQYNRGEFIRLYNFNGLDFLFIVVGTCNDWALIG